MKKNVRVIPEAARSRLKSLREQCIVAGCARQFSAESIRNGALAHLQIQLDADGLHVAGRVLPRAAQGKYSARNIAGYEVVRRDLPKETHYNVVDAPDWGTGATERTMFYCRMRSIREIFTLLVNWSCAFIALTPVRPGQVS